MKVSTGRTHATFIHHFTITEDHPVVPMSYAVKPRAVRIDWGEIAYTWRNGDWVVDTTWSIKVSGRVLRRDGSPGKARHARSAPHPHDDEDAWPWLDELINLLRPAGGVTMAALTEHEVRS